MISYGKLALGTACLFLPFFLPPSAVLAARAVPPLPSPCFCQPQDTHVTAGDVRGLVEDDWLRSAEPSLTTQSDAAGACDGVKNGTYGFHVGLQSNPWWWVDLGETRRIGRIVVYNRLDYAPGLHNADTLQILVSVNGKDWSLCHDNQGQHFGGIQGADPLEACFDGEGLSARFVRLTIPSAGPIYFHLDM